MMKKLRTLQIKLLDDDYNNLVKFKNKIKAKNWYDFCVKISEGDKW